MPIQKIIIKNFTVFDNIEIDFCSGINVFIGENGTGKTHLLKILYAFCGHTVDNPRLYNDFDIKLKGCFQNANFSGLARKQPQHVKSHNTIVFDILCDMQRYHYGVSVLSDRYDFNISKCSSKDATHSVYIPAKEMLTHSRLEKDFAERNLPFDTTHIDILNKAGVSTVKKLCNNMQGVLNKISTIIGGAVVYQNDRYYIDKGDGRLVEFAIEAEGFKKLGLLYRLVETGHLKKGSVLFWDEPEANINPKRIPDLVEILLELTRNGVQVFLATHDYFFAKYLEIYKEKYDEILYHALYKLDDAVLCESQEHFEALENNSIIEQSINLYKDELKKVMV